MTLQLKNSYLLYLLVLFIPFVDVLKNQGLIAVSYLGIILPMILFFYFKIKVHQLKKMPILIASLMGYILFLNFMHQKINYSFDNYYFLQFFGIQIIFFLIFYFFVNINVFFDKYFNKLSIFILSVIFLSIVIDYFLLNNGMLTSQLMYRPDLWSYFGKPMGIFGQFSINTTYAVIFLLLFKYTEKSYNLKINLVLFFMLTVVIILENSGSGYIAYVILLFVFFSKNIIFKAFIIPIFAILVVFIILNNILEKFSLDYIIYNFEYFSKIVTYTYTNNIHSLSDVLFGIDGNYNFPIDFGPLFMIAKVGLMYFIAYSMTIFYMLYKEKNKFFRAVLFILLISNLHYPTLFYPVMNVLLPILMIHVLSKQNKYKGSDKCSSYKIIQKRIDEKNTISC